MFKKAEETRGRILNAALELFRQRGFEQTTMRDVANEAGVALGSAYYYFESKEALVLAFYERACEEMLAQITEALSTAKRLDRRLQAILDVKFEYFAPNRLFLGALFRHAADPKNALSPFSAATRHIRDKDLQNFSDALEGVRLSMPADLAVHLPKLLWLYQMGLILFWIYDTSPGQRRTAQLRDKSVALIVSTLKVLAVP
jgi:AcrR family transcriptional regulator